MSERITFLLILIMVIGPVNFVHVCFQCGPPKLATQEVYFSF